MYVEEFELYLRETGHSTDHEIREVLSRISWVETTLNISLDQLIHDEIALQAFKEKLMEVIGSEDKTEDFYRALWSYHEFCRDVLKIKDSQSAQA